MRWPVFVSTLAATALAWAVPQPAEACGGTFCDNVPQPMPIDQTGENILFVLDGPRVEAHIQINIDSNTNAEKFAWVIPVPTVPEFSIGSDPLFNSLLAASVPSYSLSVEGECGPGGDQTTGMGVGFIGGTDLGSGGVQEELHEIVGALDITVLSGGTADELSAWLIANDYAEDASAVPILEEYLAEGMLFAAIKLANQAGVDEVHPLVMSYESGGACVPLRLTAIAATDDMEVRTFFLGDYRVAPTNYRHLEVNPLKIDWLNQGDNYKEVVTRAVDQFGADGNAFVTEFAGPSAMVNSTGVWSDRWDASVFVDAPPENLIMLLSEQGLLSCFGQCQFGHPLLLGLLRNYLPPPTDIEEQRFWSEINLHAGDIDQEAWDGPAFAADFTERIIDPGLVGVELLETWPYLTRLYTTISPGEMTVDPMFASQPELGDVAAVRRAVQTFLCEPEGASVVTLPDGREVYLPPGAEWPDFSTDMPWEEDVDELMEGAAPVSLVDNTELIDELLQMYNQVNMPPPDNGTTTDTGGVDPSGDDTSGGGSDDAGQSETQGSTASCSCQTHRGLGGSIGFGLGLLAAGIATRRRRRTAR